MDRQHAIDNAVKLAKSKHKEYNVILESGEYHPCDNTDLHGRYGNAEVAAFITEDGDVWCHNRLTAAVIY